MLPVEDKKEAFRRSLVSKIQRAVWSKRHLYIPWIRHSLTRSTNSCCFKKKNYKAFRMRAKHPTRTAKKGKSSRWLKTVTEEVANEGSALQYQTSDLNNNVVLGSRKNRGRSTLSLMRETFFGIKKRSALLACLETVVWWIQDLQRNLKAPVSDEACAFGFHPPTCTDAKDAAQPLLFHGRLAITFALWRSCVIAESQDHKSGWGYFCRRQTRTLTLTLGGAVWAPMAGECSGSASVPPECNAVSIKRFIKIYYRHSLSITILTETQSKPTVFGNEPFRNRNKGH